MGHASSKQQERRGLGRQRHILKPVHPSLWLGDEQQLARASLAAQLRLRPGTAAAAVRKVDGAVQALAVVVHLVVGVRRRRVEPAGDGERVHLDRRVEQLQRLEQQLVDRRVPVGVRRVRAPEELLEWQRTASGRLSEAEGVPFGQGIPRGMSRACLGHVSRH